MTEIRMPMPGRTREDALTRRGRDLWLQNAGASGQTAFAKEMLADPKTAALLDTIFAHSPYLTHEFVRDVSFTRTIIENGPDRVHADALNALIDAPTEAMPLAAVMTTLRLAKRRIALTAGLADIAGAWALETVTAALSQVAEITLKQALKHLLATPPFAKLPRDGEGLVVLGMGKLGAYELNYSSDIDLIVFYDDARFDSTRAADGSDFVRLTRSLMRMMDEKTGDGYVFRTDLRLRPDPASTPLAVSLSAAEIYYGSLGQNWERAAMIKARQIAGDPKSGDALFNFLNPWIWRRSLDFAAIEDIHSIKRQIDRRKLPPAAGGLLGHNVKLGAGGIREIEFFTQTQQLIFGGRDPSLRAAATCNALRALAAAGRIAPATAEDMVVAYRFLRTVEHRLQMVDDQQTHSLPRTDAGMEEIAGFLGFAGKTAFTDALSVQLERVHEHFAVLFSRSPSLSGPGSLVFTGVEDDPETLETLVKLGFTEPRSIAATIRGWHHGRYRATRSARARELLTTLTPEILIALGATAEPDAAFFRFDTFLAGLPSGVTVLSLFVENRRLLGLLSRIVGMAPVLAEELTRTPSLFDELLERDFFAPLSDRAALLEDLKRALAGETYYEDVLIQIRRWVAARKFQAGVHILEGIGDGLQAARFLAFVAEATIECLLPCVEAEFAAKHGTIPGGGYAIVALGRLGAGIMSFISDLDLIAIYDAPASATSDGDRPLDAPLYYTRLTQRLITAVTAPMAFGRLYTIDLRLRPSGEAGPVAVSLDGFRRYHAESSWTWEHMALTFARVIAGPVELSAKIKTAIDETLTAPRDPGALAIDVAEMRRRIAAQYPTDSRWNFKYTEGGLVDTDFTIQYLLLRHLHDSPDLLTTQPEVAALRLAKRGYISAEAASELIAALQLAWRVQGLIRLNTRDNLDPESAAAALKSMLACEVGRAIGLPADQPVDFAQAETILDSILAAAHRRFVEIVDRAAADAKSSTQQ
jgi:glutamate-ammonia-ligase adenylyltransferase